MPHTGEAQQINVTVFAGFPNRMDCTPVPRLFFTAVLPLMDDLAELRVALLAFHLLSGKRQLPRAVSLGELVACQGESAVRDEVLAALRRATERQILLELAVQDQHGVEEFLYLLNTDRNRRAVAGIREGRISLAPLPERWEPAAGPPPRQSNIFTLFQENIGLITPIIADELRDAEIRYPAEWVTEAFAEAVAHEKRFWRYIVRILEGWAREGKGGRAGSRGGRPAPFADPRDYIRGPYAHLIKH